MDTIAKSLIVKPGRNFKLSAFDPSSTPGVKDKAEGLKRTAKYLEKLSDLQYLLYAEGKRSLLIVLQGIDAGGKDGTIRHVMEAFNPLSTEVTAFKVPDGVERKHDYLWRIHKAMPEHGEIGIFNRSHYEDVLVVRVHDLVPKQTWEKRYQHINEFERMASDSGTTILKFFLYISKDEQKKRFEERLADPTKNWKFSMGDLKERQLWDNYTAAFEDVLNKCSTEYAPWYVIPANKKWYRNLAISEIITQTLEGMNMKFPEVEIDPKSVVIE
jgi:PPK2 family polyphosphate:nucleotide phosphotransferase